VKSIYGNTSHALFDQDLPFSIKFYEEPQKRKKEEGRGEKEKNAGGTPAVLFKR
jgi:hypothetical protein